MFHFVEFLIILKKNPQLIGRIQRRMFKNVIHMPSLLDLAPWELMDRRENI